MRWVLLTYQRRIIGTNIQCMDTDQHRKRGTKVSLAAIALSTIAGGVHQT